MDTVTPEKRSKIMSKIRGKNTQPELAVRKILHSLGFRFRLHRADLPGKPDIVLPKHNAVILVHGCFWHRHKNCRYAYQPKTNVKFWDEKFIKNINNDEKAHQALVAMGWRVLVLWECETNNQQSVTEKIRSFLAPQEVLRDARPTNA